ncbi:hypothetical protein [Lacisediminihabitans profunda]|uniref:Uncharacterized protein n=1 Tax=Lacisediminihabitans profunda TaxID=2594790 RepID=A0A5C8UJD0_9MICO|nr:hypothetical protein [Lacisediminihabitans profunda]TXN28278.1 hypothetical protein FVP33_17545 [Lacisediminihabitans profunda]
MSAHTTFDWWFRNRQTGRITLGQSPNLPITIFAATTAVGVLVPRGPVRTAAAELAVGVLAWWAVDEIVRGVNPYRRLLGVGALASLALLAVRARRR